jgi:long-subunit fatty acid transport protein
MKTKAILAGALLALSTNTALAGGILTNTNQSVSFLKNPARDAAIGLDGVYSNPAGVVLLPEGLHLAINWQYAHQTRTIKSTNPLFMTGLKNNGSDTKTFEGIADAPFIPSVQAAYNKGNWSYQFNFSIPAGGGACEFDKGLGSFESAVGLIGQLLGANGYDVNGYMRGRQYYFGFQVGTAYKIDEHWSVYGGLRALYGNASYKARLSNIQVVQNKQDGTTVTSNFDEFLNDKVYDLRKSIEPLQTAVSLGADLSQQQQMLLAQGEASLDLLNRLQHYSNGVNLMSNQEGFGVAPVIGVDYHIGDFNFAAKYEFNTEMKMKNRSTLEQPLQLPKTMGNFPAINNINKFADDTEVDEDIPAMLAVGAQWTALTGLRLNVGYHHYFDKNAQWFGDTQDQLSHGSNEYLGGVEWDVSDRVNISTGVQITRYGLTDEYMNDLSFVVNSYSTGFGISYKVSDKVTLSAAYFQTNYGHYDKEVENTNPLTGSTYLTKDNFTRTNRVLGLGCQVDF